MAISVIPRREFGSTGYKASVLGIGCAAIGDEPVEDGIAVVNRAIDLGINYIDTADCYGHSEETVGRALGPRRDEIFLATKYCARDAKGADESLHRSLELLRTDRIDLFQLHGLSSTEDMDKAFARDGAMDVVIKAQEAGIIGHLGITGHVNPPAFVEALKRYPFACVLVPISVTEAIFFDAIYGPAQEAGAGLNAMKLGAGGGFLTGELIAQSLRYNLTLPTDVTLLGLRTVEQVEHAVSVVLDDQPMMDLELGEFRAGQEAFNAQDPSALWWRTGAPVPPGRYRL